jgi:hypothetical protein
MYMFRVSTTIGALPLPLLLLLLNPASGDGLVGRSLQAPVSRTIRLPIRRHFIDISAAGKGVSFLLRSNLDSSPQVIVKPGPGAGLRLFSGHPMREPDS